MDRPQHQTTTVADVMTTLNGLLDGRLVKDFAEVTAGHHPFVMTKDSGIPGKSCLEIPGLIWGRPDQPVHRIGICMTLTECVIELAHGVGVDLLFAHHPVSDAASSGGVPISQYLPLYGIALAEAHEALHGLHPGIPWLHGHEQFHVELNYDGIIGNAFRVGRPLPGVSTVGDIIARIERLLNRAEDDRVLATERELRGIPDLAEAGASVPPIIYEGSPDTPVSCILHLHPHGGFTVEQLHRVLHQFPEVDVILTSISRVSQNHPLVVAARELGLPFIAGNTHALEIFENGLPLAYALEASLPGIEVLLFRERVTAVPVSRAATGALRDYGRTMAEEWFLPRVRGLTPGARVPSPTSQEG